MLCMHTQVHTHTSTYRHSHIHAQMIPLKKNIHFHGIEGSNAWPIT
jgi:hypothetical protein